MIENWYGKLLLMLMLPALVGWPSRLFAADKSVFLDDVMPLLSRAGCNQGPCHGSLHGRGGFRLSLRGEDSAFDFLAIVKHGGMRRVDITTPDSSLLLKKAIGEIPHEGGKRFDRNSQTYLLIRKWIENGASPPSNFISTTTKLEIIPKDIFLEGDASFFPIKVLATEKNKNQRDVSSFASFETSSPLITISPDGRVVCSDFLEGSITARYQDQQVSARIIRIPLRQSILTKDYPKPFNYVDVHVNKKLERLKVPPGSICSDEVFLRRVTLDLNGRLPDADEAEKFLADRSPNKRINLVNELMERNEFSDVWALKWSDILRNDEKVLDAKGVRVFHDWIKRSIAEDKPLNQFAREIVEAKGSSYSQPETNFYRALRAPDVRAEAVAQVFLGLRLQCAKCHNHPFDQWTQEDYHRFAGFFSRLDYRIFENNKKDKLDKNEFVGEQIVLVNRSGAVLDPKDGKPLEPRFLGSKDLIQEKDGEWLTQLSRWLADPENPYFAKAQANRIWFHLFGRGIVDPLDDFRTTNLPLNDDLLKALASDFQKSGFSLKGLIRVITSSATYQRSSAPSNSPDDFGNFAYFKSRPLQAEELLDAISKIAGKKLVSQSFNGASTAVSIPGPGSRSGSKDKSLAIVRFLSSFGKPVRSLTCECERSEDNTLGQAFLMISGDIVLDILSSEGNRIEKILRDEIKIEVALKEVFLTAFSRAPSSLEIAKAKAILMKSKNPRDGWEDILWGVVNSKEFLLRQ
ncbi:MAG: DUF1549 domain-containing protein [Planctomycetes bacterium]|nr:DUF1549 domain-containing protein [Planctomycetota bacterium]NBY02145.1 DUF1549 domain-containing protein [Planctomycetota bacterium]